MIKIPKRNQTFFLLQSGAISELSTHLFTTNNKVIKAYFQADPHTNIGINNSEEEKQKKIHTLLVKESKKEKGYA